MRNYRLKREIITICLVDYQICSLFDRLQFDEDDREAMALGITSATWSLFGVVWPASRILAAEVSVANLAGKRVLEIGCGIGLASIVLHKMGADITASDYHPRAKEFLDRNVLDNGLSPIKFQAIDFEQENPLLGKFDLIIASDVLYQPHHAENLARLIAAHSSDDVEVIVVDPGRENRARFTHNMDALGYSHQFSNFNQQLSPSLRCKGRILHYRRQGSPVGDDIDFPMIEKQNQSLEYPTGVLDHASHR
jgi:2-polyprenyl-3-methyl-5-hydroxy-6-metoxy-1,4-benzoquinol methylase